jgi:endonuclease IV
MYVTSQIKKLKHTLQLQEQYIKYLYSVLEGYESKIEDLRQKNKELHEKLKNALESASLKEKGFQALERQLIEVDALNIQLKAQIKKFASRYHKNMKDPLNPIMEILDRRRTISECLTEIHLFLDHNRILIPQDIDDIFSAATQNLDAIIWHANELQNIGEDQINIIDGLQILLDESFERINRLDQELINTHTNFTYKRNGCRYWENIAQNIQREHNYTGRKMIYPTYILYIFYIYQYLICVGYV